MPLDSGTNDPILSKPVVKPKDGQRDDHVPPPDDGLTDKEREKRLGELEDERRKVYDQADDRGDGLTEDEQRTVDAIERARDELSGLDRAPDGPASDDEALTPEREHELDLLERELDRQEQLDREEPGDFPTPDGGSAVAGTQGSNGSGGGSGSGDADGGDSGPGGGGSGNGGGSGDGDGDGSGDGGGDGGGSGDGGGGATAMGGEDGGTEHNLPGAPARSGGVPSRHGIGDRTAENIRGHIDGAVDPTPDADPVHRVSGPLLNLETDEARHREIPHINPAQLTQPHSDPRVTDPVEHNR